MFIDVILQDEESENEIGGALAGEAQQLTLDRRANRMGTQELNHMNSLLLHLREDNKSLKAGCSECMRERLGSSNCRIRI